MGKTHHLILLIIFIVVIISVTAPNQQNIQDKEPVPQIGPQMPQKAELGSADYGKVTKIGSYGNPNATRKIAFIVGVHPLEANAHKAIVTSILNLSGSLNSSYYIYIVNVTKDIGDYDNGRINGQLLAYNYVIPDIEKNNFQLVIDVHSNRGKNASYQEDRFLAVPVSDNKSESIAFSIRDRIPWLVYYIPPKEKGPSSPKYVSIPLIKSGIPTIVYETYMYEPYDVTLEHASEFILTVDGVKI